MSRFFLGGVAALCLSTACAEEAVVEEPGVLEHRFEDLSIEAGEEIASTCQSWTLNNDEPVYLSAIGTVNGGFVHHANWFYVPDTEFAGPDGTWDCGERGFAGFGAAVEGGVLFWNSTQSTAEEVAFSPGAAVRLPPHSRILVDVHLLNVTESPATTRFDMTLDTVPEADVIDTLNAFAILYFDLDIAPNGRSEFFTECDFSEVQMNRSGATSDFRLHAGSSHYHELGLRADAMLHGGAAGDRPIYESIPGVGDAQGVVYTPPVSTDGASSLSLTCAFDNPRDERIGWGIGDQEMCAVGFYISSPLRYIGMVNSNEYLGVDSEGTHQNTGTCALVALEPDE